MFSLIVGTVSEQYYGIRQHSISAIFFVDFSADQFFYECRTTERLHLYDECSLFMLCRRAKICVRFRK